ncbi:spore germination protein [Paenibacillus sp. IHB B 3415]|uniref:spore germination protein n=1 Tax=Paenibacillus sp. IHB B 3415 TaxID=867080 RepID=UPI00128E403A|nr:spore germination protein [Paenibacillus sp. IHB B 3415]
MSVQVSELSSILSGCFDFIKRDIVMNDAVITLFYIETICDSTYISQYIIEPLSQAAGGPEHHREY